MRKVIHKIDYSYKSRKKYSRMLSEILALSSAAWIKKPMIDGVRPSNHAR